MTLLEETIERLEVDLEGYKSGEDVDFSDSVTVDWKTVEDAIALLKGKSATWVYTLNDENRARWKCSKCGDVKKHRPTEKRYCDQCGAQMKFQA